MQEQFYKSERTLVGIGVCRYKRVISAVEKALINLKKQGVILSDISNLKVSIIVSDETILGEINDAVTYTKKLTNKNVNIDWECLIGYKNNFAKVILTAK
ncbi:MAG: hypothetical protein AABY84_08545 [Candidatus Firestonebacteria bacterium]